jgi:hypothetical protein
LNAAKEQAPNLSAHTKFNYCFFSALVCPEIMFAIYPDSQKSKGGTAFLTPVSWRLSKRTLVDYIGLLDFFAANATMQVVTGIIAMIEKSAALLNSGMRPLVGLGD